MADIFMTNKDFFNNVFEVVEQIPRGRVTTYGAIAKFIGSASSSRMVGWAMNHSHSLEKPIPAHRVVNRVGLLSGKAHFGGNRMQELLEAEGIEIIDDQVKNFDALFWDPAELMQDVR